jgi:hypothetical protein
MPILRVPVPGALNGHVNDTDERLLLALHLLCAADYPLKANKWPSAASAPAIEAADDKIARRTSG